jgi:hypothetical protein
MKDTKICNRCKIEYPLDNFYKSFDKRTGKYRYRFVCKKCYNIIYSKTVYDGARRCEKCKIIKNINEFDSYGTGTRKICKTCLSTKTKTCSTCGVEKPLSEFRSFKKNDKTYYSNKCKECIYKQDADRDRFTIYDQLEKEGINNVKK